MTRHLAFGLCSFLFAAVAQAAEPAAADAGLQKQLKEIRDELNGLRVAQDGQLKNFDAEQKLLLQRLSALEKKVDDLAQTRVARSYTPTETAVGAIRLQNRSGVVATVLLSGKAHRLMPMETVVLQAQPAGLFSYEVLAEGFGTIRSPLTRTLVAGETFSITVNP